jgi:hypothetical protein
MPGHCVVTVTVLTGDAPQVRYKQSRVFIFVGLELRRQAVPAGGDPR